MHKSILKLFELSKQFLQFLQMICWITVALTTLYWIQNLINAHWGWMDFIKGYLEGILGFSNAICPAAFSAFGTVIDVKYITALILLAGLAFLFAWCTNLVEKAKCVYGNLRIDVIKANEKIVNYQLQQAQKREELKQKQYSIFIKTRISKQCSHLPDNDLDDQNRQMNEFICQKTGKQYINFQQGFVYSFEDISGIDDVLEVMFKVLNAKSRLDYLICVQLGNDLGAVSSLADLNYYGKIIMAADVAYRYKFNKNHRYKTENIGVYQKDGGTSEVHEFVQKEQE